MELKTQIHAEDGEQQLSITREFDLPVELLFKAYTEAPLLEQWMNTKVLRLDNHAQGGYRFETTDPKGNKHLFSGTIHGFSPDKSIIRTFEMENTPYSVQLEFLDFEAFTPTTSKLNMHVVYRSAAIRDQILQLPFKQGINWAHNRLQEIMNQLK